MHSNVTHGNGNHGNGNHKNGAAVKPVEPIAIIGMRGCFPGAQDLDQYWKNLSEGVESIAVCSQEDMRSSGIPDSVFRLPGYVNASPVLEAVGMSSMPSSSDFGSRNASLIEPAASSVSRDQVPAGKNWRAFFFAL